MGGIVSKYSNVRWLWQDWNSDQLDPDVELQHQQFETAVIEATEMGDIELLRYLHEHECMLFWTGGIDSVTTKPPLLHRAAAKGHKPVVEYLLSLGLDVDETDSSGMTVLHMACKTLKNACLPPLMARSRDIDKRDVWGRTPLIKALVYRNEEAAQMLLERGANPNATDIYGMTPLTTAIDYNMMDVLSLLVRHGADVNLITHHHHGRCSGPPLYLAINNQNLPIVQELLRLGASTQPRIQDYQTSSLGPWTYIGIATYSSPLSTTLTYSDAVSLSMYEIIRHGEANISESSTGIKLLIEVLSAHGFPLGPSPDVLIRVLINSQTHDFSTLLYKLQVCSGTGSEDILLRMVITQTYNQQNGVTTTSMGTGSRGMRGLSNASLNMTQRLRQPPRLVSSLQNQARRAARKALMASNHNVAWACKRLQCPPALKTLLLLKEVDRVYQIHDISSSSPDSSVGS